MGFFAWIILGLIAGAIAKAIMPGRQGGGWIVTIILGIVGGLLGGWLGSTIFNKGMGFNLYGIIMAVVGSLIVLVIWGFLTKNKQA